MLKIVKTRLEGAKAFWAYRTTARVLTGETPFKLTFGTEAVIPVEVGLTSYRVKTYEDQKNQQELNSNLDLFDKVREEAIKQMAKHKEAMARYYNRKVKVRRFNIGDFVLRKVSQVTNDPSQGKLGPT